MSLYNPTYGGSAVFGTAVSIRHQPNATAQQINSFFGIQGTQAVFGGLRGRTFLVEGLFVASTAPGLRALQAALLAFADGVPRTLYDTLGYSWSNVIYKGEFQEGRIAFNPNGLAGYCQPYKTVFIGLT